jgi:hypothetical protein
VYASLFRSPATDTLLVQVDANQKLKTFIFSSTDVREVAPPLWVRVRIKLGEPSLLTFALFLTPPYIFGSVFGELFHLPSIGYTLISLTCSFLSLGFWIYLFFWPAKRKRDATSKK